MQPLIDAERKCNTCEEVKPLDNFPKHKGCAGGYRPRCKACSYIKQEEWRRANIKKVRERVNSSRAELKTKAVEMLGSRCYDCDQRFPDCVFDFHHLNPEEKDVSVANIRSWPRMEKEISKCVLLCANCHRIRHHNQEEGIDSSKEDS